MYHYLKQQGIETVLPESYHFGTKGHAEWTKVVLEYSIAQHRNPKFSSCKPNLQRKIITMPQVQPMVDKKRNW
jgi:hypothetical protein